MPKATSTTQKNASGFINILGIDCGTAITGWAILELDIRKKQPKLLNFGTITTHKFTPEPMRLVELHDHLEEILEEYKPSELAIEEIFFSKNVKTAIKVAQARGVVLACCAKDGINCEGYTPNTIKEVITGHGAAEKSQIQFVLSKVFKLSSEKFQDDAADAIAVAYCHYLRKIQNK